MKVGKIVYHVNYGAERFLIRKIDSEVATCDRIDKPKVQATNSFQVFKILLENLRESSESFGQLYLF